MNLKKFMKNIIPYGIVEYLQWKRRAVHYKGDYPTWDAAVSHASGYDAANILDKVKSATFEVLKGNAVFERDSVLFYEEEPNYPLITAVMRATIGKQELKILDFGGGLGSVYFQNRKFFSHFSNVSWRIVEQKHFVDAGRELFCSYNTPVSFYFTLDEAMKGWKPDIVLLSSVLQYLPDYKAILEDIKKHNIETIVIDRCLCWCEDLPHRYCIQSVSKAIYKASYAVQLFNLQDLISVLSPEYQVDDTWFSYADVEYLQEQEARYYGMVFSRNKKKERVEKHV